MDLSCDNALCEIEEEIGQWGYLHTPNGQFDFYDLVISKDKNLI